MSVLEGMACGKPVIGSRIGGIPEMVVEGETGVLFEPGDVAALRAILISLMADPGARRSMGQAARRRVEERYSLERHNEGVMAILSKLARRKGPSEKAWI